MPNQQLTDRPQVRPPSAHSPELAAVIAQIAEDAVRRRAAGGGRPDLALALVRAHRLGAVRVPTELGGGGYTKREFYELVIRLGQADPDVPHILRVHWGFTEDRIRLRHHDRDGQWLADIVGGVIFGGSNTELNDRTVGVRDFETRLTPDGDGYRLSGRKFYSTGSLYADILRIGVNDPDGEQVVAVFPADRAGVELLDDWDGFGQAETGSGTTVLTEVRVEADEVIPFDPGAGGRPRQSQPQLLLHAIAAGILRSVADDAAALLRSRRRTFSWAVSETPTSDPQLLEIIGNLVSAAFVAESTVLAAADAQDRAAAFAFAHGEVDESLEEHASLLAAKTKVGVEGLALKAAGDLFAVSGASATRASAHLDRHWRNLRTLFSHNPTPYKARSIGDHFVNGTSLPLNGFF
ncbi:acyl-CoA dehydrogenase [Gordonia sp. ABSL1-1]|uniref:acyl-CoA dehydrogenase n=1 Tax=Gordonia sp. ABSL1-1 TaxID=3053923 RepID=UPI0025739337|nr:acyl-CoA dehydrogenase [Gordonia sp. ABSL1-1]MDL9935465.1 acyl-CoA dehydrogenase [Gordonia sp. ABSL1-1]